MNSGGILRADFYLLSLTLMSKHKKHEKKHVKKKELEPAKIPETDQKIEEKPNESFRNEAKKIAENASMKAKVLAHNAEEKIDEVTQKARNYIE